MPNASPANQATSAPEPSASDVVEPLWKKVLNDRFTILEPIGVGGMGKVYKAIQSPLDRVVAIKILTPNGGVDPGFRQRFFLEASLTSKLRHPNTVTVIDYGETPDVPRFSRAVLFIGRAVSESPSKSADRCAKLTSSELFTAT